MKQEIKVSVILPVYNNERTIRRCIESVLEQTYKNIELLIVDDGSRDTTHDICMEYKEIDKRIVFQRIMHGGVVRARNCGLAKTTGTYVTFIDADDYYYPDRIRRMVQAMERSGADLVVCSYHKLMGNYKIPCNLREAAKTYEIKRYLRNTLKDPGHHYYGVVWNKMYRRQVIREHTLFFDKDAGLGEDFIFNLCYFEQISTVTVVGKALCCYDCSNDNSLSRNSQKTLDDVMFEYYSRVKIYEKYIKCFQQKNVFETYKKRIQHYWVSFYIRQQYQLKKDYKKWKKFEKKGLSDLLENDEIIKESLCAYSNLRIWTEQQIYGVIQSLKDHIKQGFNYLFNR